MSVESIYKSDGNVDIVVAPEIPVSPRTFRQLLANRLVIEGIRAEKIDFSRYSDLLTLMEKKRTGRLLSLGPGIKSGSHKRDGIVATRIRRVYFGRLCNCEYR